MPIAIPQRVFGQEINDIPPQLQYWAQSLPQAVQQEYAMKQAQQQAQTNWFDKARAADLEREQTNYQRQMASQMAGLNLSGKAAQEAEDRRRYEQDFRQKQDYQTAHENFWNRQLDESNRKLDESETLKRETAQQKKQDAIYSNMEQSAAKGWLKPEEIQRHPWMTDWQYQNLKNMATSVQDEIKNKRIEKGASWKVAGNVAAGMNQLILGERRKATEERLVNEGHKDAEELVKKMAPDELDPMDESKRKNLEVKNLGNASLYLYKHGDYNPDTQEWIVNVPEEFQTKPVTQTQAPSWFAPSNPNLQVPNFNLPSEQPEPMPVDEQPEPMPVDEPGAQPPGPPPPPPPPLWFTPPAPVLNLGQPNFGGETQVPNFNFPRETSDPQTEEFGTSTDIAPPAEMNLTPGSVIQDDSTGRIGIYTGNPDEPVLWGGDVFTDGDGNQFEVGPNGQLIPR